MSDKKFEIKNLLTLCFVKRYTIYGLFLQYLGNAEGNLSKKNYGLMQIEIITSAKDQSEI